MSMLTYVDPKFEQVSGMIAKFPQVKNRPEFP